MQLKSSMKEHLREMHEIMQEIKDKLDININKNICSK